MMIEARRAREERYELPWRKMIACGASVTMWSKNAAAGYWR